MTERMKDYVTQVREMRYCQRMYIETRDLHWLMDAKRLEKKVDELTNMMEEILWDQ